MRDVIRHNGAVAVVALTDDGRICLVRQYRTALGRVTVEIPAGKLDPGEDPLDAAHRELLEETGFAAKKMAYLTSIASTVGFCDEIIHLYMATSLTFSKSDPDDDEFINVDMVELPSSSTPCSTARSRTPRPSWARSSATPWPAGSPRTPRSRNSECKRKT